MMKTEKIVSLIAWIPISLVTLFVAPMLGFDLVSLFYPRFNFRYWYHMGSVASDYVNAMVYIVLFATAVMTIAGEVILARHGYGTKRFWKHYAICYAAYVVFTVGMTILEGTIFDTLSDPPIIPFAIAFCLYPGITLLLLMVVVATVKGVIELIQIKHP